MYRTLVAFLVLAPLTFVVAMGCSDDDAASNDSELPAEVMVTPKTSPPTYAEGDLTTVKRPLSTLTETPLEVVPTIESYDLPLALEEVGYLDLIEEHVLGPLSDDQKATLMANGVVAVPAGNNFNRFEGAYEAIAEPFAWGMAGEEVDPPILITSDSLLHLYHLFFDQLLKYVEVEEFIAMLGYLVPGMVEASAGQQAALPAELTEPALRNKAFFAVAAKLLDPDYSVPADVEALVDEELALIEDHASLAPSPLFNQDCPAECDPCDGVSQQECVEFDCVCEDYTQYVPRGHYTQSEALGRYFKAMMWLGRMTMRIKSDMETMQAVLATDALKSVTVDYKGAETAGAELWFRIYEVTGFVVGASDDLTFVEYDQAIIDTFGSEFALEDLADATKLATLKEALDELRDPAILGGFVSAFLDSTEETKGWRFMGQRFAPDSYVLGQMVWNHIDPDLTSEEYAPFVEMCIGQVDECTEITLSESNCVCENALAVDPTNPYGACRLLPRGSDVMAVLGSDYALEVLQSDERYCGLSDQLDALMDEFSGYTEADWTQNAYWSWLHVLEPLNEAKSDPWPAWMQSAAWKTKELNATLASWAQLRHDTILYVKQSYTPALGETSAPMELDFAGYVEPVPAFYHRLQFLSELTRTGLQSFDVLPDEAAAPMIAVETLLGDLETIAIKELTGVELDSSEQTAIIGISDTMERIITKLAGAVTQQADVPEWCEEEAEYGAPCMAEASLAGDAFASSLVADVHTDGNTKTVLEVATGNIDWVIVVHATPSGQLVASVGPIFTYYEFPHDMADRLTDEAWRGMLGTSEEPARPAWTSTMY